jgi:2-oxoisovalerate dehydrogenase E1 component
MGPFHAQTFEAIAAHVPGIDVFMPSTASDAAGLLHAALASPRPALFLYPKALLNDAQDTSDDVARQFVPIGVARRVRAGRDLTLVGWGNTVGLCVRVAEALLDVDITTDIFDLRSLSPWDQDAVVTSTEATGRLLVIHEDNLTCGFGAEVVAQVTTRCARHVRAARLARPDVHIPYHFGNQLALLPTFRSALTAAASLLDLDLSWDESASCRKDGHVIVPAIGSGPSDETVFVAKLLVRVGDHVNAGDPIAVVDAEKSAVEMVAPEAGIVESIAAAEGEDVPVGAMLLTLRNSMSTRRAPVLRESPATPHLRRSRTSAIRAGRQSFGALPVVGVRAIAGVSGSRIVANPELLLQFPGRTEQEVVRRTGIVSRRWIGPGEDALSLAAAAAQQALHDASVCVDDVDLVICSTGTPLKTTPSMACLLLAKLGQNATRSTAYDMNAACSGYIYALRIAYDFLHANPTGRALVVTAEVLSEKLDVQDFETAFLFGDAATATLLVGDAHIQESETLLYRPLLGAKGENGDTLSVPVGGQGAFLTMHGTRVFSLAVRWMTTALNQACCEAGLTVAALDLVVPHQANRRILDAVQSRIGRPVFSNVDMVGNTSSSSIPLALSMALKRVAAAEEHIGLCAFGGGFTFGAAVMRVSSPKCCK